MLQDRDLDILDQVRRFRALRTDHLAALLSPVGHRVLQARLRRLWEHRLLDRRYLPAVWGADAPPTASQSPIHVPTGRGLRQLAARRNLPAREERAEPMSIFTLAHDLVAIDVLVGVQAHGAGDVAVEPEHHLRRVARDRRARPLDGGPAIVPDGAVIARPGTSDASTFYLEVVLAGARSGNARIAKKLGRYAELLRDGYFERAFGHPRLRAVFIATTSARRAETLRAAAERALPRASHWPFRFGALPSATGARIPPAEMLAAPWLRTDGRTTTLAHALGTAPPSPMPPL